MLRDAIIETDDRRWEQALRRFSGHDFHHLPGYAKLEAERRDAQAFAFVYEEDQNVFLVPFIEAPVPLMLKPAGMANRDALAPYGYAGPLVAARGDAGEQEGFITRALHRLVEHLRARRICAALMRFHPLLAPPLKPFLTLGKLILHGETVCVDLRQPLEQMWSDTRHGARHPINRLQRLGYKFELDFECAYLDEFMAIYHETMFRVRAEPQYFFSEEYIHGVRRLLGANFVLAHVRNPSGRIVSSGIFTVCSNIVQYYLSGNRLDGEGSDASKLVLHGVRGWAKERGLEKFHLGGGLGARNDSLFQFKSGFSSGRAQFHTWRLIVDAPAYNELCECWERVHRRPADMAEGFFPPYRKPLPVEAIGKEQRCA